jgi:Amt family ammonium transporter
VSVRHILQVAALAAVMLVLATAAQADPAVPATLAVNAGNTAWLLTSTALVLFMTVPGLALFYGGLVQSRNVLSVLAHCFAIAAGASVIWAIAGYSLAYSGNGPYLGDLDRLVLNGMLPVFGPSAVPESVYVMFQMAFAIITPALIIGAFPERVQFGFVVVFSLIWLVLVYIPVTHWIWGNGWLAERHVIDFAGGIVVHTTAGISALVAAIMIGPRRGFPDHVLPPHNPGMTMTGAGMLWVGWFGFNAGSALAADGAAGNAMLATHLSAAAGAFTWMLIEWIRFGKPSSVGIVTGLVAGLATITPAAGHTGPMAALAVGVLAGVVCFSAVRWLKITLKIDDSLDVFGVHGVGGILGSLLVAVTALPQLGGAGLAEGMTLGSQFVGQAESVGLTALWSAVVTVVLIKGLTAVTGFRCTRDAETEGLDLAEHGERAYDLK